MQDYLSLFDTCRYRFDNARCILEDKDLGISADIASVVTPPSSVSALTRFQGCPYTNSELVFDVITDGETVRTDRWIWLPNAMYREGAADGFRMWTVTAVIPGTRTVVQKITYESRRDYDQTVSIQVAYRGCTRYESDWRFSIPAAGKSTLADYSADDRILTNEHEGGFWRLTSSIDGMTMFATAYLWEGEITIPADGSLTVYFSAHMGTGEQTAREASYALSHYEEMLCASFDYLQREVARIDTQLPRLTSDNPELDTFYDRSLVTYIMCRWENPDLCTSPYYSTAGVNGGCMVSYLWNYCGGLMLHPLYDPEGNKKNIKALLHNDLTRSYALNPVTAGPVGPWYPVNQEKIIQMVYYHVLFTGELDFLSETVDGKTILDWMRYHAYVGDDLSKPVALYDYGVGGDSHLELRREYRYNGVMPDLNARRYMNYLRVWELTVAAGQPDDMLPKRAEALREVLKTLWNEEAGWYDHINAEGVRDTRYTVQMFKFLSSPVIDEATRRALIAHLNEREFLSKYGLHSMSKLDPAYDQDDIDNGGGGICGQFTMQICSQLYDLGYDTLATDMLLRVLWWGTRMPYMGDSAAANMIANREDTPLQGDIASASCAQMIFYYIFGIRAGFDGTISVTPVKNRPAQTMRIDNARLCGKVFSVEICGEHFTVTTQGKTYEAPIGGTVQI